MIKSFNYIREVSFILEKLIDQEKIDKFQIKLGINQNINIFISSSEDVDSSFVKHLLTSNYSGEDRAKFVNLTNSAAINIEIFHKSETGIDGDEAHWFEEENVDLGLRRALGSLLDPAIDRQTNFRANITTFFSHKGGVGRTTSLALLTSYFSEQGKKVFIVDCDFEAPGLLNFFSISQFDTPRNGLVEYLNDLKFDANTELDQSYVYDVSKKYSGEGAINLLPAGNIFSEDRSNYLEGLARLDLFGADSFYNDLINLIERIEKNYSPDIILFDSRTGFNNVFGALSQVSNNIVALFGDDVQNRPGLEFLLEKYCKQELNANLTLVLSIISSNFRERSKSFSNRISAYLNENLDTTESLENHDLEPPSLNIPTFFFPRESALELIGTESESIEDFKYFSSKHTPTSYSPFFSHMESKATVLDMGANSARHHSPEPDTSNIPLTEESSFVDLRTTIIERLKSNFPEQYAENESFNFEDDFLSSKFYLRQCMQDIFLPEYRLLLGGKGTGKTFFYKALQKQKFVNSLILKAEKKHLNIHVINVVAEMSESSGFFDLTASFENKLRDESFVKKFWILYICSSLSKSNLIETAPLDEDIDFDFKNDMSTSKKIERVIDDCDLFLKVEERLRAIDNQLRAQDKRIIATFDQLDVVARPELWDIAISPLIRFCQSNIWERITPKLFLRRDLFEKLGNITNKKSLESQSINLEWSPEEMYAFFFKVIFSQSKTELLSFLETKLAKSFLKSQIESRLNKKNSYNQLPDESYYLRPIVNAFFGEPQFNDVDSYDCLYRNIRNANETISLRPFLDMIKFAIDEQHKDGGEKVKSAILGIDYCMLRSVRAKAVERYFLDLANEAGNDVIKYFIEDYKNNLVPDELKVSSLLQKDFERIVGSVKKNHPKLAETSVTTFEEMLVLNGIIFVTMIPGGRKKFSFAYLYKFYLELRSPGSNRSYKKKRRKNF